MTIPEPLRKYASFGTGVGIEIEERDLLVSAVKVRPKGVTVLGAAAIANFRERPAAEWGAEYAAFLKSIGESHLAATIALPRRDMIVRTIALPGVSNRDLAAAVRFQLDSLHPYAEDDAVAAWARIGNSPNVLVGIVRREIFEHYRSLFAEAGIKVASLTFSAAVAYTAIRVVAAAPKEFLFSFESSHGHEIYGESAARPVFSAVFDQPLERALALAAAEMRLPPDTETSPALLPQMNVPCAAALSAACPWFGLEANLLPEEIRVSSSRAMYIPTAALASVLLVLLIALSLQSAYEDGRYAGALEAEIAKLQPQAAQVDNLIKETARLQARTAQLDQFRARLRQDMDAFNELTAILAPPTWLNYLEITPAAIAVGGEADQAAGLLKIIDSSPHFLNSEFTLPIARVQNAEVFRVRAQREAPPGGARR